MSNQEHSPLEILLILIVFIIAAAYTYYHKEIMKTFSAFNSGISAVTSFITSYYWVIIIVAIVVILLYLLKDSLLDLIFYRSQKYDLTDYISPEEYVAKKKMKENEEIENVYNEDKAQYKKIKTVVGRFTPAKKYKTEYEYQIELLGWLKHEFPRTQTEVQTSSSRPDIVIDNVAIELKGPTRTKDLQSISSKILRYLNHYDHMLIVLFDLEVSERYYEDWYSGIKSNFPHVDIIEIYSEDELNV